MRVERFGLKILVLASLVLFPGLAWTMDEEGPPPPVLLDDSNLDITGDSTDPALRTESPGILYFDSERMNPKDPQAALVFSLLVPGLGHIYSESYLKGLFFFAAFGGSVAAIANNGRMVPDPSSSDGTVFRNAEGLNMAVGVATVIYAFAAYDARGRAKAYNRKRGFRFAVTATGPTFSFVLNL